MKIANRLNPLWPVELHCLFHVDVLLWVEHQLSELLQNPGFVDVSVDIISQRGSYVEGFVDRVKDSQVEVLHIGGVEFIPELEEDILAEDILQAEGRLLGAEGC